MAPPKELGPEDDGPRLPLRSVEVRAIDAADDCCPMPDDAELDGELAAKPFP